MRADLANSTSVFGFGFWFWFLISASASSLALRLSVVCGFAWVKVARFVIAINQRQQQQQQLTWQQLTWAAWGGISRRATTTSDDQRRVHWNIAHCCSSFSSSCCCCCCTRIAIAGGLDRQCDLNLTRIAACGMQQWKVASVDRRRSLPRRAVDRSLRHQIVDLKPN